MNRRLVVIFDEAGLAAAIADWVFGKIELHAVFPAGKAVHAAARAFTEFLVAEFAKTSSSMRTIGGAV